MVKVIVSGALGRMGRRITELAEKDKDLLVVGGVDLKADPNVNVVDSLDSVKDYFDCIIEFTTPTATIEHVKRCTTFKKSMVIGTTGLSEEEAGLIKDAAKAIPIVYSPNMSVGVNVLFSLIEKSALALDDSYKISIEEAHHIHKKDKPSGTAKLMSDIAKKGRADDDVPINSIRKDEIVGDHTIVFESSVDILRIAHSAKTRDIFALGALKAAKFVCGKKKGLFSMRDVLAL
ncbi:MAG: 4-hydroxy-tetrahydrodipicolinate reductase [Candidatus Omnitrophota bacterium]